MERHAGGATIAFRSNSMFARCVAVRNGVGVGFLPCFVADAERGLVRLGDVVPEASATLWILSQDGPPHIHEVAIASYSRDKRG